MIKTELKKGTDHEMEHTSSRRVARKIAKDHLKERPNYYTRLDKCMPEEVNEATLGGSKYKGLPNPNVRNDVATAYSKARTNDSLVSKLAKRKSLSDKESKQHKRAVQTTFAAGRVISKHRESQDFSVGKSARTTAYHGFAHNMDFTPGKITDVDSDSVTIRGQKFNKKDVELSGFKKKHGVTSSRGKLGEAMIDETSAGKLKRYYSAATDHALKMAHHKGEIDSVFNKDTGVFDKKSKNREAGISTAIRKLNHHHKRAFGGDIEHTLQHKHDAASNIAYKTGRAGDTAPLKSIHALSGAENKNTFSSIVDRVTARAKEKPLIKATLMKKYRTEENLSESSGTKKVVVKFKSTTHWGSEDGDGYPRHLTADLRVGGHHADMKRDGAHVITDDPKAVKHRIARFMKTHQLPHSVHVFDVNESESVEQIDEISGRLVSRYRQAAKDSAAKALDKVSAWHTSPKDRKNAAKTLSKRTRGLVAVAKSEKRTEKRKEDVWKAKNKAHRDEYFTKHDKESGYHQSTAWVGRVNTDDPDKDAKIAAFKKKHGSLQLRGRLGKDNPNAHLYRKGGPLKGWSNNSYKIQHAKHIDVYARGGKRVDESRDDSIKHMTAALFGAVKVNRSGKKVVDVDKQRKADLGPIPSYTRVGNSSKSPSDLSGELVSVAAMKRKVHEANSPHTAKIKQQYYSSKAREIKNNIHKVDNKKSKSKVEHDLTQATIGREGGEFRKKVEHKLLRYQQAAAAAKSVRERHPSRWPANESVEQIDELSKGKLLSYIQSSSIAKSQHATDIETLNNIARTSGTSEMERAARSNVNRQHGNRSVGIQRAAAKLAGQKNSVGGKARPYYAKVSATESIDEVALMSIDEISKNTLINYQEKSLAKTKALTKRYNAGIITDKEKKEFDRRVTGQILAQNKFYKRSKIKPSGVNKPFDMAQAHLKAKQPKHFGEETIDELSRDLLKRYRQKAMNNGVDAFNRGDEKREKKRQIGYAKAKMRLDGVSPKTLHKVKNGMF